MSHHVYVGCDVRYQYFFVSLVGVAAGKIHTTTLHWERCLSSFSFTRNGQTPIHTKTLCATKRAPSHHGLPQRLPSPKRLLSRVLFLSYRTPFLCGYDACCSDPIPVRLTFASVDITCNYTYTKYFVYRSIKSYTLLLCTVNDTPVAIASARAQHGGWLPLAAMEKVAKIVGQHEMKVYEVATFYTMFNREKRGKHFIQLCGTTPCMVCGSEEIKKTIMDELGIKNGGGSRRDERRTRYPCSRAPCR